MSIVMKPNQQLVNIVTYYIEEVKKAGSSVFYFIDSAESMESWKRKGYITRGDMARMRKDGEVVDDKVIEELHTVWRSMTWKEQNEISSKCLIHLPAPEGQSRTQWDGIRFRDMKLKTCLKGWDLVDDSGNKIPVTPENIDNLVPEVAHQLASDFEKMTEPSEDDLGN